MPNQSRPHLSRHQPARPASPDHGVAADRLRRDVRHHHDAARGPRLATDADRSPDRLCPLREHREARPSHGSCPDDANYKLYREHLRRTVDESLRAAFVGSPRESRRMASRASTRDHVEDETRAIRSRPGRRSPSSPLEHHRGQWERLARLDIADSRRASTRSSLVMPPDFTAARGAEGAPSPTKRARIHHSDHDGARRLGAAKARGHYLFFTSNRTAGPEPDVMEALHPRDRRSSRLGGPGATRPDLPQPPVRGGGRQYQADIEFRLETASLAQGARPVLRDAATPTGNAAARRGASRPFRRMGAAAAYLARGLRSAISRRRAFHHYTSANRRAEDTHARLRAGRDPPSQRGRRRSRLRAARASPASGASRTRRGALALHARALCAGAGAARESAGLGRWSRRRCLRSPARSPRASPSHMRAMLRRWRGRIERHHGAMEKRYIASLIRLQRLLYPSLRGLPACADCSAIMSSRSSDFTPWNLRRLHFRWASRGGRPLGAAWAQPVCIRSRAACAAHEIGAQFYLRCACRSRRDRYRL